MKKKRTALWTSLLALLLCVSMLVGTTFAWFTDSVTSGVNQIIAGNLDVDVLVNGKSIQGEEVLFDEITYWEPGVVAYENLTVTNLGTLALKYQLSINFENETKVGGHGLSEALKVGVVEGGVKSTTREAVLAEVKSWQSLANFTLPGDLEAKEEGDTYGIVIYWQPTENDNLFNMNNDLKGNTLSIDLGVKLLATQQTSEMDSFDEKYDDNAAADFFPGFQGGSAGAVVAADDQGVTTAEVAMDGGDVSAVVPAGVQVADGVSSLALSVTPKDTSDTNIQLTENEVMRPLDVHIEGVAEGNTVPMLITLERYLTTGINTGALKLYHVENGTTVAMTQVDNPVNHNEFSYDPLTGDLTLALASFSEVATIADTTNTWDGASQEFTQDTDGTYLIANASQLAYFRDVVDGEVVVEGLDPTFAGKTVKLTNNITLSGVNFDPIGWGYVNTSYNRDGAAGKVFMGTFDGGQYDENGALVGRNTIFDLYQNGWDLDPDKENYSNYTYTNCGFGLFASASGATFKNLTISGADIVTECVEMGVLVGLSQNTCTYNNIKILDSKIANYQRPAGGLIGEVSGDGTTTISDVVIGGDVVVGTLWGDFDAPVGGVIGARWDDQGKDPQIKMTNVDVGARLDVYNDITSAYQWHAYRRAGMLIGNTELTDPDNAHKAAAPFLTCENVKVYYGDWVNYTYCAFSNHNSRYPWVRTQAGENCSAFSNPRWGVPNDANDNRVTDMNHVHQDGDECNVLRQFGQLYGGGQGVYGQDTHEGVTTPSHYSITYVNDSQVLDIIYVTDNTQTVPVGNDQAQKLVMEWAEENIEGGTIAFGGWMNAASIKLTEIPADNTKNVVLYPYFNSPYTASFVDQQGQILAWCLFNDNDVSRLDATFDTANEKLPKLEGDFELINWQIRGTDTNDNAVNATLAVDNDNWESFKDYKDVTISPKYRYKGADLIEVYDELTGEIDHYEVAGYTDGEGSTLVEIPDYVNGAPVTTINANAFSSYDDLTAVRIPATITSIGTKSFSDYEGEILGTPYGRDTVTLYYEGTLEQWKSITKASDWDNAMGEGSRVFFLDENGKVIESAGYLELCAHEYYSYTILGSTTSGWRSGDYVWVYHAHDYIETKDGYYASKDDVRCRDSNNNPNYHYESEYTEYTAEGRPDQAYWTTSETTAE